MPSLLTGELGSLPGQPGTSKGDISVSLNALSPPVPIHNCDLVFIVVVVFKGESIAIPIPKKAQRCKDARSGSASADLEQCCLPEALLPPQKEQRVEGPLPIPGRRQGLPPGVMCLFF